MARLLHWLATHLLVASCPTGELKVPSWFGCAELKVHRWESFWLLKSSGRAFAKKANSVTFVKISLSKKSVWSEQSVVFMTSETLINLLVRCVHLSGVACFCLRCHCKVPLFLFHTQISLLFYLWNRKFSLFFRQYCEKSCTFAMA